MRNRRRRHPQDVLRWLMGVFVIAVVASAATSAVFLTARKKTPQVDPLEQKWRTAQQVSNVLSAELEAAAKTHVNSSGENPPTVVAVYRTETPPDERGEDAEDGDEVPMVDPDDNMLMKGTPTPWQLEVSTATRRRRYGQILDIRDTGSISSPGYWGIVEIIVETSQRELVVSGSLPFQPPEGFQVITPAKYTELQASQRYNVQPVSSQIDERRFKLENWAPVVPPPAELPEAVRRQFNQAIVQCSSRDPTVDVRKERLTFFYSLRERKWTPRPRMKSASASP